MVSSMSKINIINKYYLYTAFTQLRFTRIINILFIIQILHVNLIKFAILQSVFLISQFLLEIPSGVLGDLIKKRTIVLFGLGILTLSPMLIFSTSFLNDTIMWIFLFIGFALEGVGNALLSGADDAIFYQLIRDEGYEKEYAKVRGRVQLTSALFLGVATFLGGVMYQLNYALPYFVQALMICGAVIVISTIPQEQVADQREEVTASNTVRDILSVFRLMASSANILYIFLYTTLVVSGVNALFSLLPEFVSQLGFSPSSNGMIFMIYSFIGGAVATQAYRFEKISIKKLVLLISTILIMAIGLQITEVPILLLFSLGLIYITVDLLDPIVMTMLNAWVDDKSRATFISGLSFLISLMTVLVTPIMAMILEKYDLFVTSCITTIVIILLSLFGYSMLYHKNWHK